jgi:hypothetical protein
VALEFARLTPVRGALPLNISKFAMLIRVRMEVDFPLFAAGRWFGSVNAMKAPRCGCMLNYGQSYDKK